MIVVFFLKKYFGTKWNYLELLISKVLISEKNCSRGNKAPEGRPLRLHNVHFFNTDSLRQNKQQLTVFTQRSEVKLRCVTKQANPRFGGNVILFNF